MASDTEDTPALQPDEGVSPDKQVSHDLKPELAQDLEDVRDRLGSLSDKINMCKRVLNNLKDLSDVLVRKSLKDVTLPLQK